MRLEGKVAIITGAASGIGRATAIRFAEEGASVIIADINEEGGQVVEQEIREGGGEATFVHTDVGNEEDLRNMIQAAIDHYGGLDILYNNAYWTDAKRLDDTTVENWHRTLNITLRPAFLATKLALPHLRARGGGVVLHTGSIQSVVGFPSFIAYQAAKGGVLSLTRAQALELAEDNIRVVAILPGATNTPAVGIDDPDSINELIAKIPMARLAEPEELANTAVFLASDEAPYITGTSILVDGGYGAQ